MSGDVRFVNGTRTLDKLTVLQYRRGVLLNEAFIHTLLCFFAKLFLFPTPFPFLSSFAPPSPDGNKLKAREIGFINKSNDRYTLLKGEMTNITVWPGGTPSDGSPVTVEKFSILGLAIFCYFIATASSVAAVVCIVFTIVFRKRPLVRLHSPNLNLIIGFGAIFFNSGVYFFFYPEISTAALTVFCNVCASSDNFSPHVQLLICCF